MQESQVFPAESETLRGAEDGFDMTVISKLRKWIVSAKPQTSEIGLDTHLIDEGVLDSLQMVGFLLYIEETRGREIPVGLIRPDNFVSLRVIYQTFFR
jgi:acyl carrier protein